MTDKNNSEETITELAKHLAEISIKLELLAQSQMDLLTRQKNYQRDLERLLNIVEQVGNNQQQIALQQARLVQHNEKLVNNIENLVNIYTKMVDQQKENRAATEHLERVVSYLLKRDKQR